MFENCKALEKFLKEKTFDKCVLKTVGLKNKEDICYLWKFGMPSTHDDDLGFIGCYGIIISASGADKWSSHDFKSGDSHIFWMNDSYYETDSSFKMISKEQCINEITEMFDKNFPVYESSSNGVSRVLDFPDIQKLSILNKIKHKLNI